MMFAAHTSAAEALVSDVLSSVSAQYSVDENTAMVNALSSRSASYRVDDVNNSNDDNNIDDWLTNIRQQSLSSANLLSSIHPTTSAARDENVPITVLPLATPNPTPRQPRSTPFSTRAPLGNISVNNSNIKANTGTATKLKKLMKEKDAEIFRLRSQLATLNVDSGRGEENNGDDENDKSIRLAMTGHQEVLCTPAKTTASSSIDDDIENECPLCMSPLKKNPNKKDDNTCSRYVVITHCGHQFHLDCLQRTRNFDMNNCPMCREDLPPGITPFKEKEKVILANRSEGHVPPRYVPPTQNNNDVFHGNGNNVDDDENAIVNPANNNRRSLGRRLRRRSNNNNNENNNGGDLRVNQSKACVIS